MQPTPTRHRRREAETEAPPLLLVGLIVALIALLTSNIRRRLRR